MAVATYTCTVFNNTPKQTHIGNVAVSGSFNYGATKATVGDVIFLAKIPHGAYMVSIDVDHTTGATATALSYGLGSGGPAGAATYSCYIASGAQGAILRRTVLGLPAQISCSDNDPNRYGILTALVESGTTTTSLIINFTFVYRCDGGAGGVG